jgi:hypothetical protein
MKIKTNVYAHMWGVILPSRSGVVWEQQTDGVCCNHVEIEGVFIPFRYPGDLLEALSGANYDGESTIDIWRKIKEEMYFDFVDIEAPKNNPRNQEGIRWIRFTKFESGWGTGDWVRNLIGKDVCLIYPNCD